MASRQRRQRNAAQEGQALLVVLVAVTLLSLIGAAMTALWVRSVTVAQRRADATAALYAAEAGIARGIEALTASGGTSVSLGPEAVGEGRFRATYMVSARPLGDGSFEITSTGTKGKVTRSVRVRLTMPFAYPVYAGRSLEINAESWWLGKTVLRFSPAPASGNMATVQGDVQPQPVQRRLRLPGVPFAPFAAAAGPVPTTLASFPESGGALTNAWYQPGKCRGSATIKVPAGVRAGIAGDLTCRVDVQDGATLVVTGNLKADEVRVRNGGQLIVGGEVDVDDLGLLGDLPARGGGLIVAGGPVYITKMSLLSDSVGENALAILALDRSGCTAAACGADESNDIRIDDLGLLSLTGARMKVIAYAGPLPGQTPRITLNFGNLFALGSTDLVKGSVVSAGDLTMTASTSVGWNTVRVEADPAAVATFTSRVPGAALWTQLSWAMPGS
ncbi:MAG TPA: hypothetical protein VIK99_08570 [Thermaerobacter sp.]